MRESKIGLGVLAVGILVMLGTTVAVGSEIPAAEGKIIPVAERAREHVYENAAAWEHSPVINIDEDGNWVLTPSLNGGDPEIPAAERAREHVYENAAAWEHSPVINIDEDGNWVLTPSTKAADSDITTLNALLGVNQGFPEAFSTEPAVVVVPDGLGFVVNPEPGSLLLLGFGALGLLRRRRA